ncbi:Glucose--fructose oxidoreductase precursor [Pseudovibrio axinellae]|uniref:Glucose--fructose oxidoreductase n=1 Tax=Pseudovibrio axinellae TaxID=989403 RepID=A0A165TM06_9HYPH|nr:Gfo/Idh/MocA family oxidoreductase [Pseudovibrio axinellae]KZL06225.1 Glucose--fructose oxidoreductase precursor [Pseudovibrio axinellae]SER88093.1 Predicted dehydrogenase [Pseudovibrio axinellae]
MEKIGVGLIGTGFMGKCHALAWNSVSSIFGGELKPELVMLAAVDTQVAAARAQDFGFAKSTSNWRDMLAEPEIQIISITTPNQFHAEMAIAALEAGKHVYCEKPMSSSLGSAKEMLEVARRSGRKTFLGYNYMQNPMIRHMRDLVKTGDIGEVFQCRIELDEDFLADPQHEWDLTCSAATGPGALDDFGVHAIAMLDMMDLKISKVMCRMARPYKTRPDQEGRSKPVENYDTTNVLFELTNGGDGSFLFNRAAWGRKCHFVIEVFGSKGSVFFDQERMNELSIYKAEGPLAGQGYTTILSGPTHTPYDCFMPVAGHGLGFNDLKTIEVNEILKNIQGKESFVVDFEKGIEYEAAINAMISSHETSTWIDVASD